MLLCKRRVGNAHCGASCCCYCISCNEREMHITRCTRKPSHNGFDTALSWMAALLMLPPSVCTCTIAGCSEWLSTTAFWPWLSPSELTGTGHAWWCGSTHPNFDKLWTDEFPSWVPQAPGSLPPCQYTLLPALLMSSAWQSLGWLSTTSVRVALI